MSSFWTTILGKIIRWAAYLPVALILLALIEILASLFFVWLFDGSMRMLVVIGILLGGLFFVMPVVGVYYGVIVLANSMICPTPRVGVIVFAFLYFLGSISPVISVFTSDYDLATIVTLTILRIVFLTTTWFSVAAVYSDGR